ncbi:MAG: hypothetical protein NC402_01005 [Prevotella sp.]|nr:hypothetical protein [Prevotella sp.]MCM1074385.1 hypothetical protein [Ruminococcus sp.]
MPTKAAHKTKAANIIEKPTERIMLLSFNTLSGDICLNRAITNWLMGMPMNNPPASIKSNPNDISSTFFKILHYHCQYTGEKTSDEDTAYYNTDVAHSMWLCQYTMGFALSYYPEYQVYN